MAGNLTEKSRAQKEVRKGLPHQVTDHERHKLVLAARCLLILLTMANRALTGSIKNLSKDSKELSGYHGLLNDALMNLLPDTC